jgi:hypothetical protein
LKVAIVTGSDEGYAVLLKGLLSSIRERRPEDADFDLHVLDGGLSEASRAFVAGVGGRLVEIGWPLPETMFGRPFFQLLVNKVFLPQAVPGYDLYLWIDADAWIQDWEAVTMFLDAATRFGVAAVPEADRSYLEGHGAMPMQPVRPSITARSSWIKAGFGEAVMEEIRFHPLINAGVFAARSDSPLWTLWPDLYREALSRCAAMPESYRFMMDQTSLNVALLKHIRDFARLPAWCNWTCINALPVLSGDGPLLEAGYPHRPLGIVHPVGTAKRIKLHIRRPDGSAGERNLRYPGPIAEPAG